MISLSPPLQSDEHLRLVADLMPQLVWTTNAEGYHDYYNRRWYEYTGLSVEETAGEGWQKAFHPDDLGAANVRWRHSLTTGEPYETEYRCRRHDGVWRWFLGRALPMRDAEGRIVRWFGTCTDIDAQKHADQALQRSEDRYQLATRATKDAIWDWDLVSGRVTWNEGVRELFGYAPEDVGHDAGWWKARLHPEDHERVVQGIHAVIDARGNDWHEEYRFQRRDGSYAVVTDRGFISYGERGDAVRMVGAMQDITQRQRAEMRLRMLAELSSLLASSLDYQSTLEQVARLAVPVLADWCAVLIPIPDGRIECIALYHRDPAKAEIAAAFQKLLQLDPEAPSGAPNVLRTGKTEWMADFPASMLEGRFQDEEQRRLFRALGLNSYILVPLTARGRVLGALGLIYAGHAGSNRRHTEEDVQLAEDLASRAALSVENALLYRNLQASEHQFRALAENLPALAWSARPDGYIDYYNQRWYEYTGTTLEQMAGWGWMSVHDPAMVAEVVERIKRSFKEGTPFEMEFPLRGADGVYRWFLTRMRPLRDTEGRIARWFGTNTNIDEQRRQAAELDQFAYVTSHDLKAPLRGIANLSEWIEEDLADRMTDEGREQMKLLRGRVHRLEALIEGILQYSRAGRIKGKPRLVAVDALVAEVVEMLAPGGKATVSVQPGMPTLMTDSVPLQQVFMNLIGNALKHSKRPDTCVEVGAREIEGRWEFFARDNGPGIAPRYHERIWGIFQTLEPRDKVESTGIGLSVVRKIVEARGGRAWVESEEGQGATFRFTWPKQEEGGQPKSSA